MENNFVYSVIISSKAQKEIAQLWEWYEERQSGLGSRFLDELNNKLKSIEINPEQYSTNAKNYREALIKVFPLLIIYKINKRRRIIKIDSVFHTSRDYHKKYKP